MFFTIFCRDFLLSLMITQHPRSSINSH